MALTTISPAQAGTAVAPRRRAPATPAWRHVDLLLVLAGVALTCLGVLMVYSTTRVPEAASGASPGAIMTKQATYAALAFGAFLVTVFFDYKRYLAWAPVLYIGSILLLLATLAIGRTTLGATSWIQVGSIEVEPAELVKVTFIVSLAALLASRKGNVRGRVLILVLALSVVPFVLVYKQDALGSAMVLAVVMIGMLLMAGTRGRHMFVLALVAVVAIGGVSETGVLKTYQKDRLLTFLTAPSGVATSTNNASNPSNPYAASIEYNLDQSKAAIANGGISGKGLFKGPETNLSYVPNQDTDFIFTAMAEQFGFIGSAVLLALFAIVVWRSWRASLVSRDLAGTLICVGVLSMFMFQVFENVGMTMGIMPVAGITLPFMSYGGSSMVVDWVAIGLVVNVGMRRFALP